MAFTVDAAGSDASAERFPYLDGWRGTAIGALLIGHFVSGFGDRPRFGMNFSRLGVELFFVLSGLLMGNLLFVRNVPIATFYKRRIARLFPALYFYLLAITIVLLTVLHVHPWKSIAAVFLLYFNYYAAWVNLDVPRQYHHIWSLCIEEHCYILLSCIALLSRRGPVKDYLLITGMVLVSWGFDAAYAAYTDWTYYQVFWRTETRLDAVFISAGLVCWLRNGWRPLVNGPWILLPLLAGVALQSVWVPDMLKYTLGTTLLAVAVTHLRFAPRWMHRLYEMSWLRLLGVLSYSLYLWQQA
jgi:peptidoglycan/LPS O-acetylase OafA/YrhL